MSSQTRMFPIPDVLFVPGANPGAAFIALDRSILGSLADLHEIPVSRGPLGRLAFVRGLDRHLSRRPALLALWFAAPGYGSLTAAACRRRGVPYLAVSGGADVANVPAAGFGAGRLGMRRPLVRWILEGAAVVWAFSEAAGREIAALAETRRLEVVPPPVDTPFFRPRPLPRERDLVLTVCARITPLTIAQKGLDRVVDAARALPAARFVIAGALERHREVRRFVGRAPANVAFAGFVSRDALRTLYARAQVYAQLSRHEGFGVSVAEAMAMGCVPVTSDLPALHELAGDAALVAGPSARDAADVIGQALDRPAIDRWQAIDARCGPDVRRAAWMGLLGARDWGLGTGGWGLGRG